MWQAGRDMPREAIMTNSAPMKHEELLGEGAARFADIVGYILVFLIYCMAFWPIVRTWI